MTLLQQVLDGTARIEERLAVCAEAIGRVSFEPQWALNELMVEKKARHRLLRLALYVGDVYVTTISADGVIVATPTGSTAYSFSGGGPIVSPTVPCLIVTPVAAHMVFDRSLVLGADEVVTLEVMGEEDGLVRGRPGEPRAPGRSQRADQQGEEPCAAHPAGRRAGLPCLGAGEVRAAGSRPGQRGSLDLTRTRPVRCVGRAEESPVGDAG